jgi:transposase-like protein
MDKLRLVLEASELEQDELGAFLRREGLHEAELRAWVEAATTALSGTGRRKDRKKGSPEAKRIRDLEKDLHRKEKALAELAALLALKKKLETFWGGEGENTDTRSGT